MACWRCRSPSSEGATRQIAEQLCRGRYPIDHLIIYDLTGLGLLVPLAVGSPLLAAAIQCWEQLHRPECRFRRVSVLRDQALAFDVTAQCTILRGESPYHRVPLIRAADEEDLKRRLREHDTFCRRNGIRHLKAFGSILGDRLDDFDESSDLDMLVEFEPGKRVTLLDMARMERELGQLTGFEVDLRTAEDLSRYFRREVLERAVAVDALER